MNQDGIAIGELSRRTGCNIETVRYYERVGLLPKPSRRGTYRRYDEEDVERLAFVRRARELGFTLNEIRALLKLAIEGQEVCADVHTIAATHLAAIRAKIVDLRAMERALAKAVRACDAGGMAQCPVISALSSAAPSMTS